MSGLRTTISDCGAPLKDEGTALSLSLSLSLSLAVESKYSDTTCRCCCCRLIPHKRQRRCVYHITHRLIVQLKLLRYVEITVRTPSNATWFNALSNCRWTLCLRVQRPYWSIDRSWGWLLICVIVKFVRWSRMFTMAKVGMLFVCS